KPRGPRRHKMATGPVIYGLMAEFTSPEALVAAAERAHREGYRRLDAYSPFPVEGLAEAIGFQGNRLPLLVLIGGIIGASGGFFLQYWFHVLDYPMNIGGGALHTSPAFVPGGFVRTTLLAPRAPGFRVPAPHSPPA